MALQQVTKTVGAGPRRRNRRRSQTPPASASGQVTAASTPMPDPDRLYSDAVKSALLEVMLNHSLQMNLPAEEWLTVAARASDAPMPSSQLVGLDHDRAARQGQRSRRSITPTRPSVTRFGRR